MSLNNISEKIKSHKRFVIIFASISFISLAWAWMNAMWGLYYFGMASLLATIVFWSKYRDLKNKYPNGEDD